MRWGGCCQGGGDERDVRPERWALLRPGGQGFVGSRGLFSPGGLATTLPVGLLCAARRHFRSVLSRIPRFAIVQAPAGIGRTTISFCHALLNNPLLCGITSARFRGKVKSTRLGREVGLRTQIDELDAQQHYFEAICDLADVRDRYLRARLQRSAALGTLSDDDVASIGCRADDPAPSAGNPS